MENKDITLLVIEAASNEGLSPIQIQKSLFLIGQCSVRWLPRDFYKFEPYDYGPFSVEVYDDMQTMVDEKLVFSVPVGGQNWSKYIISPEGRARAQKIKQKKMRADLVEYIGAVVSWVKSLTFSELVRAIYANFPETKVNSVFQG